MMIKNKRRDIFSTARIAMAGACFLALLCALLSAATVRTEAATWMDPYLDTAVEWGVIRPDASGNVDGNKQLTRADFVAMVNRAFGYTEVGPNPYTDVPESAWYAEDIRIARQAGYFKGTSDTTASPNAPVTREQAAVLLARNLRLEGTSGEVVDFADSRKMANWSRGLVQQAARLGIIKGYGDGNFGPLDPVTQGQMATFLVRALGTRIQEPGEYSNIGAYTHLTITAPGVTLKNTVVTGNLYLAGGVGLEDVVLENVTVQGRIVVAGGGVAQAGENSVILRNVTAEELVIDSMTNQTLSIRAEGLTNIGKSDVRTSSYIEDVTKDGLGLKRIEFNSTSGATLQVAGNIKELVNRTPSSKLDIAQGIANIVTVDEKAVGSSVTVSTGASVKNLNLDTGTSVSGTGDIDHLNVGTAGSTVTMLPDTITVRPGITANIHEEEMDAAAAAESSTDPRILSGYPKAGEIAAKSAQLTFSTNKKGTLYWAVTALADGSVREDQLVKPLGSAKIIKSGSIAVESSNTEVLAKLSGLTSGGSYYVSALLEDSRGMRSPVKVIAFSTPDDTTPAFATGYPTAILTKDTDGKIVLQSRVMANKDCRVYYALLPVGATAPKAADFKAAAVSGNLGYGSADLRKNSPFLISPVNTLHLKEQTKYELYLWLTDIDGSKSSAVKKLTVETPDYTAPKIQRLTVTGVDAKSVELTFALDEPGTIYWAVVKKGTQFYSADIQDTLDGKNTEAAKMQIETGIGALKKGNKAASKASTENTFKISGLEPQTAYDLYYVAKDKSGNYNVYSEPLVPPLQINTEDNVGPTVTQEFTKNDGTDAKPIPYPDTNIDLVFSESVQGVTFSGANRTLYPFLELYQKLNNETDKKAFAEMLARHIELYIYPSEGGSAKLATVRTNDSDTDWDIDYRNAVVTLDPEGSGKMTVTFPYYDESVAANKGKSATNLSGGATYYFVVRDVGDTSNNTNMMTGSAKGVQLPEFTVVSAQVFLAEGTKTGGTLASGGGTVQFHMNFDATPISNDSMTADIYTDLIFWCDDSIEFELYYREKNGADEWTKVGNKGEIGNNNDGKRLGVTMSYIAANSDVNEDLIGEMSQLKDLKAREYGIKITSINGEGNSANWNQPITVYVTAVSGTAGKLTEVTRTLKNSGLYGSVVRDNVMDITLPAGEMAFSVRYTFMDNTPPKFTYLKIDAGDAGATVDLTLDRPNSRYFYVVAPLGKVYTEYKGNPIQTIEQWETLPANLTGAVTTTMPSSQQIKKGFTAPGVFSGSGQYTGVTSTIALSDLQPKTQYIVYLVLQGESVDSASEVYCFRFETQGTARPIITTNLSSSSSVTVKTDKTALLNYILIENGKEGAPFNESFAGSNVNSEWTPAVANLYPNVKTVLDAMGTYVIEGNTVKGTVFDLYASDAVRKSVEERITAQNQPTGTVILVGQDKLFEQNVSQEVTSDQMQEGVWYTLLIVGHAKNGSPSAFRAAYPVYRVDETPLMVQDCAFEYDVKYNDKSKVTGTLQVTFNKSLYLLEKDEITNMQKTIPLDSCKTHTAIQEGDGYDKLYSHLSGSTSISLVEGDHGKLLHAVKFKVEIANPNANIIFPLNLCGENRKTHNTALTLTLKRVKQADGTFEWRFDITKEWDATNN